MLDQTQKAAVAPQPVAKSSPAMPLSTYAGTYRNDIFGDVVIASENGTLMLTIGPGHSSVH